MADSKTPIHIPIGYTLIHGNMPHRALERWLPWISPPFKPTPIQGKVLWRAVEGLPLWIGVKPCVGVEETEEWMWFRTKHCRAFYEGVPPRMEKQLASCYQEG